MCALVEANLMTVLVRKLWGGRKKSPVVGGLSALSRVSTSGSCDAMFLMVEAWCGKEGLGN